MAETTDPRVIEAQVEKLMAEVEKMKATSLANIARAKKTNVEAVQLMEGEQKAPQGKQEKGATT